MATVISIALRKGGSGKTTTAVNLAVSLSSLNKKVLLVDLDPQANATLDLGIDIEAVSTSINTLLTTKTNIKDAIYKTDFGINIIPSHPDLSKTEMAMNTVQVKVIRLLLEPIESSYDYILLDTPPSESFLTINALTASHYVLVPLQTDKRSFDSIDRLLNEIAMVQQHLNPDLKLLGILPTLYYKKAKICQFILEQAKEKYGDIVFPFEIEYTAKYKEASLYMQPVMYFDKNYAMNSGYYKLAKEIVKNEQNRRTQKSNR